MFATAFYFVFLLIFVPAIGLIEQQIINHDDKENEIHSIDQLLSGNNLKKHLEIIV